MKLRTGLTTLIIITVFYSSSLSQEKTTFSLKDAQEYALLNSLTIKNSEIDLSLARKKIWETTAIGLPQISAQANYQHVFDVPMLSLGGTTFLTTDLPAGTPILSDYIIDERVSLGFEPLPAVPLAVKDNTTLDITVSQLIFSGEYLVGLRASKVFYLVSDQNKVMVENDVRESVANTYTLVLMLSKNHEVLQQSFDNLNRTLTEMKEMHKQGFIEVTDVDQIELTTLTLQNGLNSMERQVNASLELLKFQMGYPIAKEISLTDNLESMAEEINIEGSGFSDFRVDDNITYQIMETQVQLGKLNLQREKSTFLPNLAAVYRHTEKFKKIDFDFMPADIFLLTLNVPILSSGQRWVKVQQRRLEYDKAVNNRDNVAQGLQLEYINARNELVNAYDNYLNNKKNLELTRRIYDKTLIKFREGLSTSMELTQAQNQMLTAQSEYINNMNALLTAKHRIIKLTTNQ